MIRPLVISVVACVIAAGEAAAQTHVDYPVVAGDWLAACDQSLECAAFSLPSQTSGGAADLGIRFLRAGEAGSTLRAFVTAVDEFGDPLARSGLMLKVDGRGSPDLPDWTESGYALEDAGAAALANLMRRGKIITLTDREGKILAQASLAGLDIALRRMESRQHRTADSAAVSPETETSSVEGVRSLDLQPIHSRESASLAPPAQTPPTILAHLMTLSDCPQITTVRLDESLTATLVVPECGGYGRQGHLVLFTDAGRAVPADFEAIVLEGVTYAPAVSPEGSVILDNPELDETTGQLVEDLKFRAYGDCGDVRVWRWDTSRQQFRLARFSSMPVCRGVREFVTTYQMDIDTVWTPRPGPSDAPQPNRR